MNAGKYHKSMRKKIERITFEKFFEPSLKRKAALFLESGGTAATITKGVLLLAALGGVLAVGVMAPNLFKIFNIRERDEGRGRRINREGFKHLKRSCYHLRSQGLIEQSSDKGSSQRWRLTILGEKKLKELLGIEEKSIKKPKEWDRKWRIIIFDIPNEFGHTRNIFRRELLTAGCYPLQKSVLVFPFPCKKDLLRKAAELNIQNYVEIYTIEDFDNVSAKSFFRDILKDYRKDYS